MFILLFFIILSVLVFVHEAGHFIFAKMAGVKVEEFGFGYPPKALHLFRKWGTDFTLNWVPFGGFVKILGENYMEEPPSPESRRGAGGEVLGKKFTEVSKIWQVLILFAGVGFNFLLAWLLFSGTFLLGTPYPTESEYKDKIHSPVVMITNVASGFPAETSGIKSGDILESVSRGDLHAESVNEELTTEAVSEFISSSGEKLVFNIKRGSEEKTFEITPVKNEESGKFMVGIGMDSVGVLRLGVGESLILGGKTAVEITKATFLGILNLFGGIFKGQGDLSQVAGPVGIVGLVKDAYKLGFSYLLSFTAFISINLAIINLVPFPALDGGRILMVIVESIKGSRVNPKIYNSLNTVGFTLLLILMGVITFHDIIKLF